MKSDFAYKPWKVLVTADSQQIGMLMVSFLQSEGLEARIANDHASQYEIVGSGTLLRGAQIEVPEDQLAHAAELLNERQSGNYRIPDSALSYWPASRQELEAQIAANSTARGDLFPSLPWAKLCAALALVGIVFGTADAFHSNQKTRSRGGMVLAISIATFIGAGIYGYRQGRRKGD